MQYRRCKKHPSLVRKQGPEPCAERICHSSEGRADAQHREPSCSRFRLAEIPPHRHCTEASTGPQTPHLMALFESTGQSRENEE